MVSQNPDGSFSVTLADVYAEVRKLQDAVQAMTPQAVTLNDHESRLRSLEKWKYSIPVSLVTGIGGVVTAIIVGTGH